MNEFINVRESLDIIEKNIKPFFSMNKFIKARELWEKAGGYFHKGNQHDYPHAIITDCGEFETFVTLIVKECVEICETSCISFDVDVWRESTKKEMSALTAKALAEKIKKQFGVE